MADKKISALTGATTPLAGTEVLPIVQGGSTVKVAVSNLTAGRAVNVASLTAAGNIVASGNGDARQIGFNFYGSDQYNFYVNGAVDASSMAVRLGTTNVANFSAAGNITVNTGNLVVGTAAKGIDFSANANAPGMTSELLNDYEEGTWTPNQGGGLTVVGAFSSGGTYTKIGRLVTVNFFFAGATSVAAAAGGNMCTNLPFTTLNVNAHNPGTMSNNALSAGAFCAAERNTTNVWATSTMSATSIISCSITYPV